MLLAGCWLITFLDGSGGKSAVLKMCAGACIRSGVIGEEREVFPEEDDELSRDLMEGRGDLLFHGSFVFL